MKEEKKSKPKRTARGDLLKFMMSKTGMKKGITSWEAFERFGITRLSAVIFDLKKKHIIESEKVNITTSYGIPATETIYYYKGEKDGN